METDAEQASKVICKSGPLKFDLKLHIQYSIVTPNLI